MDTDKEIFAGKTFASLAKDIYFNSSKKSAQIEQLITDLSKMIKDAGSATVIAPMIKDYLDVGIKNDDQLVKLSAVLQRFLNGSGDESSSGDSVGSLTQSEKEELLKNVRAEVGQLKQTESEIEVDLVDLEKKSKK